MSDKLIDVEAELRHTTDKGGMLLHNGDKGEWFPKSLVEDNGDGTFTMPEWLAMEKGFI